MTEKPKFILLTIAVSVAVVLILSVLLYFYIPISKNTDSIEIKIEEGDGLKIIAQKLDEADLIRSRLLFIAYIKIIGWDDELKAGKYILSKSFNMPAIASLIVSGKSESDDISVTIPEGFNIWEIDKIFMKSKLINNEGAFARAGISLEGKLFPDTYKFKKDVDIKGIIDRMAENFNRKVAQIIKNKDSLISTDLDRIIIIASILEKEAKTEEDMKLVAGIIYKRLELGMPLQIDATVIYGACLRNFQNNSRSEAPRIKNCDVTFQSPAAEIKIDGPYNTYTRNGLPAGPISSPGLKAITAALNPTSSDFLYYLSTRDGSQMVYSKTSGEHIVNRKKYLGI